MNSDKRIRFIMAAVAVVCCGLLGRLVYLQLIIGHELANSVKVQRTSEIVQKVGGDIFDRNGVSLTGAYDSTYVRISANLLTDDERRLLESIGLIEGEKKADNPIDVLVPPEKLAALEPLRDQTPAVYFYNKREKYGPDALATHLVGYRGETGIGKIFRDLLNNEQILLIERDALGQPIAGLSEVFHDPSPRGVRLTIDASIQRMVENVMDQWITQGAVIVLDTDNGEVLAMASRPNYKQYDIETYLKDETAPLINRSISSFSPGSIFKIVILAGALEENITTLDEVFHCSGEVKVGGNVFKCASHKNGGHGDISLREAMAKSCNSVFIELGCRLGTENILKYARLLGLGEMTSLVLPEEDKGSIPSPAQVFYEDIGNLALGQGPIEITPLQACQMMMTVVNGGMDKGLSVVKEVIDSQGVVQSMPPTTAKRVLSKDTCYDILDTLKYSTKVGTGVKAMPSERYESAGKTGTAEITKDVYHSWFLGFYPADNPKYVVCVFIERGGSGAEYAAPIFRCIVENLPVED